MNINQSTHFCESVLTMAKIQVIDYLLNLVNGFLSLVELSTFYSTTIRRSLIVSRFSVYIKCDIYIQPKVKFKVLLRLNEVKSKINQLLPSQTVFLNKIRLFNMFQALEK